MREMNGPPVLFYLDAEAEENDSPWSANMVNLYTGEHPNIVNHGCVLKVNNPEGKTVAKLPFTGPAHAVELATFILSFANRPDLWPR